MSFIAWLMVPFLIAASIGGMIVFLMQYRARRAAAWVALVAAGVATLALCALTFLGSSFQVRPIGRTTPLGGFPFPVGTTWVYSHSEYEQAIGDPNEIITATRVLTETVARVEGDTPSLSFMHERSVSDIKIPPEWWSSSVLDSGSYWYRIEGNRVLSVQYPYSREGFPLYEFPLGAGRGWCPEDPPPATNPTCSLMGKRTVRRQGPYTTAVGTFDPCYEIVEEYNSGGIFEWFCDGIGVVARKYDHAGSRFGYEDTLIRFALGSSP
jgi:hypothetical protein